MFESRPPHILLKNHTTFRIGGKARYFFIANNKKELIKAVVAARRCKIPFFILGWGSNVLFLDSGFKGLIIQLKNKKYEFKKNKIYTESGVSIETLVKESTKRGLSGLEWAGGLPGTLGGAVRGNAGAFAGEIKDSVLQIEFLDENNNVKNFSKENCKFSYRNSIFKDKEFIILSCVLKLKKGDKKELIKIAKDHIAYRKERHPLDYPNAGSIFKNCDFEKIPLAIKKIFYEFIKTDPFPVVPTAIIIAKSNLVGEKIGKAQVSKKHSNYIVNLGDARAKDVKKLIKAVKNKVKNKFKIDLEEEIKIF